jgi:hypothetical protein
LKDEKHKTPKTGGKEKKNKERREEEQKTRNG